MIAEGRLVDQMLGEDGRLIVGASDLLHDHAALPVELLGIDPRPVHEIGQQVDRFGCLLGARGDVEGDEVMAGVGVQHSADALRRLVDVAVGRVLLAALEHQVLEEVGHAVLVRRLGPRARVKRQEDGQRSGSFHGDPIQRQAVGERRLEIVGMSA